MKIFLEFLSAGLMKTGATGNRNLPVSQRGTGHIRERS